MGFDLRIASAMNVLGYDIFPFQAFDERGRLRIPSSVEYPSNIREGLGRIAAAPVWTELYKRMSALDDPGHRAYMAGIGFHSNRVQVAIFKNVSTVRSPAEAVNWARAYHGTLERTLLEWAGRSHVVDPWWSGVVDQAKARLPADQKDLRLTLGATDARQFLDGEHPPFSREEVATLAIVPWLSFGLDLLSTLISNLTVRTKVVSTVFWFLSNGQADQRYAAWWSPIHLNDLQQGIISGHRSVHGLWNYRGLPVVWYGADVPWTGPGFDMPHRPDQWCQALRPSANCVAGFSGQDAGSIEVAPGDGVALG